MAQAGYSGTPLAKKLGLGEHFWADEQEALEVLRARLRPQDGTPPLPALAKSVTSSDAKAASCPEKEGRR